MDPRDIANQISENTDYDICPKCGNMLSVVVGGTTTCPNRGCEFFNEEYRKTLIAVLFPGGAIDGVNNLETLSSWIRLNISKRKISKRSPYDATINNIAAYQVAMWDSDHGEEIDSMKDILYWGHTGYKDTPDIVNDRIINICKKHRIDFLEQIAAHYGVDVNYDDLPEEDET
jgi:hypothetical protein